MRMNCETMSTMEELSKTGSMNKRYLLDTDVCIDLIRHNECVLDKIEAVGAENCFITEITIAELYYGAAKSAKPGQTQDIYYILQSFDITPLLPSLRLYGTNKAELEGSGNMIGDFDLLIGSCAVYNDFIMVTSNVKHFDHIPNIVIEDWAQKSKYKKKQ